MNELGDLLRSRRDELRKRGTTVTAIAEAAGLPESTVYEHLKRREPFKASPRRDTLERLAAGFQLDVADVIDAARKSTGPIQGDPLQLLIRSRQVELGRSARQAAIVAKRAKAPVSEATISAVINGLQSNLTEPTIKGLAAGFDLAEDRIRDAAAQSKARVTYRLPSHIEENLTPERWAKIVRIVSEILDVDE